MMKQTILLIMVVISFSACKQQPKCDSQNIKETVIELYTHELKAAIAWEYYYLKMWNGKEDNYAFQQEWNLLKTLSMMEGNNLPEIETFLELAKDNIHKLSTGQHIDSDIDYSPYLQYADSILAIGQIHIDRIMLDATEPELKKCECKATLSFDKHMKLKEQEILFDVQITSEGESYVTIYQLRQETILNLVE